MKYLAIDVWSYDKYNQSYPEKFNFKTYLQCSTKNVGSKTQDQHCFV